MDLSVFEVAGQWTNDDTDCFHMICNVCCAHAAVPGSEDAREWVRKAEVYDGYDAPATLIELITAADAHWAEHHADHKIAPR